MATLFYALGGIASIVSIICYIMVVMAMFKAGDQTLGIVSIVLCFCGVGQIFALVMGWVNADKYNIRKILPIYTVALIGGILCGPLAYMFSPQPVFPPNQQLIQP
jgi:hypothetical protein